MASVMPRRFLVRSGDTLLGEGVQFSTGHIVVWWHAAVADRPEGLWAAVGIEQLDLSVPDGAGWRVLWLDEEVNGA